MEFTVFDVGHGFCACFIDENRNLFLFDCGHNSKPFFNPLSDLYRRGFRTVDAFFLTNYDQDHISQLRYLINKFGIIYMFRNTSISVNELKKIKIETGIITKEMESLFYLMNKYNNPVAINELYPNIAFNCFCNNYCSEFDDVNNISLVTFLYYFDMCVLIPGDLEKPGWENLLKMQNFKERLRDVDIFIASHHGRESGYSEKIFEYCNPEIIIIPDGPKQYATQDMVSKYAQHSTSMIYNNERRYVLTTRKDKTINIFFD